MSAERAKTTAVATAASSTAWIACAGENGYCSFTGTAQVEYGAGSSFAVQTISNGTACSNDVFGDPDYGVVKSCFYAPTASSASTGTTTAAATATSTTASSSTTWTPCAGENQACTFSGTQQVRYGAGTSFVVVAFTNGTACSNAVFGDPDPGVVKSCSYAPVAAGTSVWTLCAAENQTCAFSGTAQVRYGTTTQIIVGAFTNGTACDNAVFGDPAVGTVKSCWYEITAATTASSSTSTSASTAATASTSTSTSTSTSAATSTSASTATSTATTVAATAPGATGANPPVIFNASESGRAGDVINLQGAHFGVAPVVYFDGAPASPLQIVNSVGTTQLAVQIPASATSALILRVSNGTGVSARVMLNVARPSHLDAMQVSPGGAFRVFGRNLYLAGSTPTVMVAGAAATVDLANSNEYMLTAVAPQALAASSAATVTVDNGNGTGPATMDRTVQTLATGSGDPFGLGVGWASGFSSYASKIVNAANDSRLSAHVACNGSTDDSWAIQSAINLANANGGGVVTLPAGTCRLVNNFNLLSNVVVQGAGVGSTTLLYDANYAFSGLGIDLAGVRNLTMANSGAANQAPILKNSTRVFLQNVVMNLGTTAQMYLSNNTNFAVQGCTIVQAAGVSYQPPYTLYGSAGLLFENNTTQWVVGAPTFQAVHDAYLHANTFLRDGSAQNQSGTVHSMTVDFAYRLAVVGNTFNVINGPITNHNRNDGESILTEGGGGSRTENTGNVASADSTSISDPNNTIVVDPFGAGSIPEDYGVAIVGGTGAGQMRHIVAYTKPKMTVDHAWDVVPDGTSTYATFVFGLEKAVLKDNNFSQNPRGIWLYHTAIRDVDVVGNSFSEGGGIYLRSYQLLSSHYFMPIYNVLIARNTVKNTTGNWESYLTSVFVNGDALPFGIATLGIEMRSNTLVANIPNVYLPGEEYAGAEGYMNMMRVESSTSYQTSPMPRVLGTILANNTCQNCDVGIRIGTGAGGTTIINQQAISTASALADWATTNTSEKSSGTVVH